MEYGMKFIILAISLLVIFLQTAGDYAIHEGRKKDWHRWKGLSLFIIGNMPLILWLMQDTSPNIGDYIASIIGPYFMTRWLFFDIFMNIRLGEHIDYIGHTNYTSSFLHKWFPKQQPMGYLWIRLMAFLAYMISWIVEWWPGHYLLHL